jgi:hypothetical protein
MMEDEFFKPEEVKGSPPEDMILQTILYGSYTDAATERTRARIEAGLNKQPEFPPALAKEVNEAIVELHKVYSPFSDYYRAISGEKRLTFLLLLCHSAFRPDSSEEVVSGVLPQYDQPFIEKVRRMFIGDLGEIEHSLHRAVRDLLEKCGGAQSAGTKTLNKGEIPVELVTEKNGCSYWVIDGEKKKTLPKGNPTKISKILFDRIGSGFVAPYVFRAECNWTEQEYRKKIRNELYKLRKTYEVPVMYDREAGLRLPENFVKKQKK